MADELTFSAESVLKFLASNGGKVSNRDLVKHFKQFLSGSHSEDAKAQFKEFVNSVATMKVEDGVKYVILKKRLHNSKSDLSSSEGLSSDSSNSDAKKSKLSTDSALPHGGILHSHSSPSILEMVPNRNSPDSPVTPGMHSPFWSSDLPPGHVPQPPPRRKHSLKNKDSRGAKYEESIRQIKEENQITTSPRNDEIQEILSPGSVREKADILNKMASEQEPMQRPSAPARRRDTHYKGGEDDDTCSVSTLDPRRKEWIIKSSQANYYELVRLLREEPKLAYVKDFNKFTALHWAAKKGNLDVIKLMAGTHKLNTNMRTGGYTPLHLAAMFGREEIMEVLINTYGADPSLRDYSGKRALHYLQKNQAERFLTLFPKLAFPIKLCGKVVSGKKDKENGLVRMGSLNSKVKRTSVLSAGRALTRMKSWGSADNIPDRAVNLMPPPKTYPKKKKSRKHGDIINLSENWRAKSNDSDSDSTSGTAS